MPTVDLGPAGSDSGSDTAQPPARTRAAAYAAGMAKKLREVIQALRAVADEALAEPWDKVGLALGDPAQDISRGLLCIDLTEAVVEEAVDRGCELIVAYHPPIFRPLERLTADGDWSQRRIRAAIVAGLAVYSPHTALDAAAGGVCDWLADVVAGADAPRRPIRGHRAAEDGTNFKVVVFVPEADEPAVRQAMAQAGAGGLGRYRECSFSSAGVGGFRPMPGANPSIGRVGERAEVGERRLEMLAPADRLSAVVEALRAVHPYEEPAFDIFKLHPVAASPPSVGAGRIVELTSAVTADQLAARFDAECFPEAVVKVAGPGSAEIRRVAVCPGSGGSLFEDVDADAYLTGEMQHHQVLDLAQRGKTVVLLGHTASERPYLPIYRDTLKASAAAGVAWSVSEADRCPLTLRH